MEFDLVIVDIDEKLYTVERNIDHQVLGIRECLWKIEDKQPGITDNVIILESYIGNIFVLCQTVITEFVSRIIQLHKDCSSLGYILSTSIIDKEKIIKSGNKAISGNTNITQVQVIDAFANYFKHRDEDLWKSTKLVLDEVFSLLPSSEPQDCRAGAIILGNNSYTNFEPMIEILRDWTYTIHEKYMNELNMLVSEHMKNKE